MAEKGRAGLLTGCEGSWQDVGGSSEWSWEECGRGLMGQKWGGP